MGKYLFLSISLFSMGMVGLLLSSKHLIIILMALEILLLSANINFVIFSIYFGDLLGQVYSLLILTLGAAESAIGLAILITYYSLKGTMQLDVIQRIKG